VHNFVVNVSSDSSEGGLNSTISGDITSPSQNGETFYKLKLHVHELVGYINILPVRSKEYSRSVGMRIEAVLSHNIGSGKSLKLNLYISGGFHLIKDGNNTTVKIADNIRSIHRFSSAELVNMWNSFHIFTPKKGLRRSLLAELLSRVQETANLLARHDLHRCRWRFLCTARHGVLAAGV